MEIERKFLIKQLPSLETYASKSMIQAYVSIEPVIRIRKENDLFVLTIKSHGDIMREEHELNITKEEFESLLKKVEGTIIEKTRYFIPLENGLTAELDIFSNQLAPLVTVEVEFASLEDSKHFIPPNWFGEDVSLDYRYKNNNLAKYGLPSDKQ